MCNRLLNILAGAGIAIVLAAGGDPAGTSRAMFAQLVASVPAMDGSLGN